jgi:hypothetical protein
MKMKKKKFFFFALTLTGNSPRSCEIDFIADEDAASRSQQVHILQERQKVLGTSKGRFIDDRIND